MAFRFSLSALLRFRESLERQHELRLHEARQRAAELQREIENLNQATAAVADEDAQQLKTGITAAALQFDLLRRSVLLARRTQLEKELAEAEALCAACLTAFQHARQQREVVETLRQKQAELYDQQQKTQEQRTLDDLFLLRRNFLRHS